ncbi:MAG: Gfo/Idh/MocA family protein [Limnochordia bacterium]
MQSEQKVQQRKCSPVPQRTEQTYTEPLRIGLVGASGHFGAALRVIAELENVQLVAVAFIHPDDNARSVRNSAAYGPHTVEYETAEALIEQARADVLIVDPPYGLHARVSLAALRQGIAVYSEKPLATTLAELNALKQTAIESGVPLAAMYELRAHPVVATAARLVRSGAIGRPVLASGQKSYKLGQRPAWYSDRAMYGGTIPWVAIHAIDWTRFITGCEYAAVSAHQLCTAPELPEVETAGTIHLERADGGSAVITFDYLRPAAAPTHSDDRFRIAGTKGVLVGRISQGRLTLLDDSGSKEIALDQPTPLFAQFLHGMKGAARLPMTTEDAIVSNEAALLALESAERHVRLPFPIR